MHSLKTEKLMACYERLLAAEAKKDELRPARLITLVADEAWVAAVAERSEAMEAFVAAARDACTSWHAQTKPSNIEHVIAGSRRLGRKPGRSIDKRYAQN